MNSFLRWSIGATTAVTVVVSGAIVLSLADKVRVSLLANGVVAADPSYSAEAKDLRTAIDLGRTPIVRLVDRLLWGDRSRSIDDLILGIAALRRASDRGDIHQALAELDNLGALRINGVDEGLWRTTHDSLRSLLLRCKELATQRIQQQSAYEQAATLLKTTTQALQLVVDDLCDLMGLQSIALAKQPPTARYAEGVLKGVPHLGPLPDAIADGAALEAVVQSVGGHLASSESDFAERFRSSRASAIRIATERNELTDATRAAKALLEASTQQLQSSLLSVERILRIFLLRDIPSSGLPKALKPLMEQVVIGLSEQ